MKDGEKLKCVLDARGFNQTAIANAIGMNIKTFNAILNGRGELKVDTLLKVFQFTGTKPETFFRQKFQDDRKNCSA